MRNPANYDMKPVSSGGGYVVLPIKKAMLLKNKTLLKHCNVRFDDKSFTLDSLQPWMHAFIYQTNLSSSWQCRFYIFIWDTREIVASGTIVDDGPRRSTSKFCWATVNDSTANAADNHEPLKGNIDAELMKRIALLAFSSSAYYVQYGNADAQKSFAKFVIRDARNNEEYRQLCPSNVLKTAWQIVKKQEEEDRAKQLAKQREDDAFFDNIGK